MAKHVLDLTDKNFETEIQSSKVPVLVDFWAAWCQPCLALAPVIESVAAQYEGKVKVGKVNVDDEPQTASLFSIRSIPTLLLFVDGKPVNQLIGSVPQSKIQEMLNKHVV